MVLYNLNQNRRCRGGSTFFTVSPFFLLRFREMLDNAEIDLSFDVNKCSVVACQVCELRPLQFIGLVFRPNIAA
jgi:hypothetical protein